MNKPTTSLLAALAFAVLISLGCDSSYEAEKKALQTQFTVIKTESHEDALEAFYEARIIPVNPGPDGTRKALQAFHDLHWMKRHPGISHPITRLQAWVFANEAAYQKDPTSWIGRMEHMGEAGALNLEIKK